MRGVHVRNGRMWMLLNYAHLALGNAWTIPLQEGCASFQQNASDHKSDGERRLGHHPRFLRREGRRRLVTLRVFAIAFLVRARSVS